MSDDGEEDSEYEIEQALFLTGPITALGPYLQAHYAKEPCNTSMLTGGMYYDELIRSRCPVRFYRVARMSLRTFNLLLIYPEETDMLPSTNYICSGERLMIFLYILSGKSNREAQDRWQHGAATISRIVRQVIAAIKARWTDLVSLPGTETPREIIQSPKFFPYFKDCIGAIDGTHIPVIPPSAIAPRFRNRKGFCSSNVLGACNFSMEFVYMLAGWEGSAHDGRVLKDAVAHDFRIPQGKYYLGDAGYALNSFTMTPYRGTRYHLKEFGEGQQKPQTKEELYNLRHSSLRNVIERTYGVVKHKFPILRAMTSYPLKEQVGLMQSSFAIHNFIRVHRDEFADRGTSASHHDDEEDGDTECQLDETDDTEMKALRDSIAAAMWSDYLIVIAGRYGEAVV